MSLPASWMLLEHFVRIVSEQTEELCFVLVEIEQWTPQGLVLSLVCWISFLNLDQLELELRSVQELQFVFHHCFSEIPWKLGGL